MAGQEIRPNVHGLGQGIRARAEYLKTKPEDGPFVFSEYSEEEDPDYYLSALMGFALGDNVYDYSRNPDADNSISFTDAVSDWLGFPDITQNDGTTTGIRLMNKLMPEDRDINEDGKVDISDDIAVDRLLDKNRDGYVDSDVAEKMGAILYVVPATKISEESPFEEGRVSPTDRVNLFSLIDGVDKDGVIDQEEGRKSEALIALKMLESLREQ